MSNVVIILSIHPKWLEKILNGEKTIEIRKTIPKTDLPVDVYIYCCKHKTFDEELSVAKLDNRNKIIEDYGCLYFYGNSYGNPYYDVLNGKIVGKFTLNKVSTILPYIKTKGKKSYLNYLSHGGDVYWFNKTCLEDLDIENYLGLHKGYCWYIDNLEVFDKPMELYNFIRICNGEDSNKCKKCPYYWYDLNESIGFEDGCYCNHIRPLMKAPQSWCYAFLSSDM